MNAKNQIDFDKAAYILKTIAHPTRLSVISLLAKKEELTVGQLCDELGCEQSLLSHHLINMRSKGLLKAERSGTSVYYSLKETNLVSIIKCIKNCDCYF